MMHARSIPQSDRRLIDKGFIQQMEGFKKNVSFQKEEIIAQQYDVNHLYLK